MYSWSRGVTVSTLDSESSDLGSNPRGTYESPKTPQAWICGAVALEPHGLSCRGAVRQLALSAGGQVAVVEWKMRGRDDLEVFLVKEQCFPLTKNVPKSSRPCFHHLLSHLFGVSLSARKSLNCLHVQLVPWCNG